MLQRCLANVFLAYTGWSNNLFGSVRPAFAVDNKNEKNMSKVSDGPGKVDDKAAKMKE